MYILRRTDYFIRIRWTYGVFLKGSAYYLNNLTEIYYVNSGSK